LGIVYLREFRGKGALEGLNDQESAQADGLKDQGFAQAVACVTFTGGTALGGFFRR
jgi:hypothetical protein